jgi:hypothetical protein
VTGVALAKTIHDEESWFPRWAEKIVRERKGFLAALTELGIEGITSKEAEAIFKGKTFQTLLRAERHKYQKEYTSDPGFTKESAIGSMLILIQNLSEEGEHDKALEGWLKVSKLMGWVGNESNVNIFAGVTGKELEELRARIESKRENSRSTLETLN